MTDGLTDKDRAGIRSALAACPKIRRAVLFGSRAIGTFRGASDVDLALEGDQIELTELVALKAQLAKLNLPVDVDLVVRASIRSPDVERHIETRGIHWYLRGWRDMTLGEFVTLQRGHDLTEPQRRPGRVPVMGSAGQNGFHDTALAKGPGVVIGRSGASFGQVHYAAANYWPHNTALYVTDFKGNDERFTYYFLKALDFTRYNSGSAQPSLNRNFIYPIPVRVPPLAEQKAIAEVLGSLDDKIELNRRMNATLEAMARAFFQSWFVDFDPVRAKLDGRKPAGLDAATSALFPDAFQDSEVGRIPKGWTSGKVSDLATLSRGPVNPGEFPTETFDHFSLPAFDNGRSPKVELGRAIMSNKFAVEPTSVLLSKLNPHIPRIWLPDLHPSRRSVCSTEFMVACSKPGGSREYLFSLFTSSAFASIYGTLVTGTTGSHQRIRPESVLDMRIVIPSAALIRAFTDISKPMFECINRNTEHSRTLATVRDTLLPKLLSGELSVANLEDRDHHG